MSKKSYKPNQSLEKEKLLKKIKRWNSNKRKSVKNNQNQLNRSKGKLSHLKGYYH